MIHHNKYYTWKIWYVFTSAVKQIPDVMSTFLPLACREIFMTGLIIRIQVVTGYRHI